MEKSYYYEKKQNKIEFSKLSELTADVHCHFECEMVFVKSGEARAYLNGVNYELKNGDLFLVFPNQIHGYKTLVRGEFLIFTFPPKAIYTAKESNKFTDFVPNSNLISFCEDKKIEEILNAVEEEYDSHKENSSRILLGYINILLYYILPMCEMKKTNPSDIIPQILNYCLEHYEESITLSDIADMLHINKYYVSRIFNETLSMNLRSLINHIRVSAASDELISTSNSITDIAGRVGYLSMRSFNRAFKEEFGVSASEYRKKYKG